MLRFRIEGGSASREQTVSREEASLGRAPGNDIVLPDESVSRQHARVVQRNGALYLEDLGGTNGTQLNGRLLRSEAAQIRPGEEFVVGAYRIAAYELGQPLGGTVAAAGGFAPSPPPAAVNLRQTAAAGAPGATTPANLAAARPELLIEADGRSFSFIMQRDEATLGRGPGNDISLAAPTLSASHAMVCRQDDGWTVIDLRSRNGTFVNGRQIESAPLHDGDRVALGTDVALTFRLKPAALAVSSGGRPRTQGLVPHGPGAVHLTIGRSPQNQLVLDSPQISRQHAVLERPAEGAPWSITDLGSMNRTYVNGDAVAQRQLAEGDVVRIGPFRLTVRHGEIEHFDETAGMLLEAFGLTKQVGKGKTILQPITLVVQPHEFVGIVGVSGAGKSTLLGALSGLRPATKGQVLLNGFSLYEHFDALRQQIGYVPQDDIIHKELSVQRALNYAAELRMPADTSPAERNARVSEVIGELGLEAQKSTVVASLSGGQRKRVSIGVELLTKPPLFFLDEPTSGLDPATETRMMALLRQLADQGRTILLITHATVNIAQCDRVVFLARGGRLAFFGAPDMALQYFGVGRFDEIYDLIENTRSPEEWEQRFHASPLYQSEIGSRIVNTPGAAAATPVQSRPVTAGPGQHGTRNEAWRQFSILTRRYGEIVLRDRKNLAILLLQAPIIAVLLWALFPQANLFQRPPGYTVGRLGAQPAAFTGNCDPRNPTPSSTCAVDSGDGNWKANKAIQLAFILAATAVWLGTLNAVREISKEDAIYRRERLVNLRVFPYIASKFAVLLALVVVQATLLFSVVAIKVDMPGGGADVGMWLCLVLGGSAAVALALAVSAAVSNPDRAVFAAPLIMLPQVFFAGIFVPVSQLGVAKPLAALIASRWTFEALARISNVVSTATTLRSKFQFRDAADGTAITRLLILLCFVAAFGALAVGLQRLKDRR